MSGPKDDENEGDQRRKRPEGGEGKKDAKAGGCALSALEMEEEGPIVPDNGGGPTKSSNEEGIVKGGEAVDKGCDQHDRRNTFCDIEKQDDDSGEGAQVSEDVCGSHVAASVVADVNAFEDLPGQVAKWDCPDEVGSDDSRN